MSRGYGGGEKDREIKRQKKGEKPPVWYYLVIPSSLISNRLVKHFLVVDADLAVPPLRFLYELTLIVYKRAKLAFYYDVGRSDWSDD